MDESNLLAFAPSLLDKICKVIEECWVINLVAADL
jgi:hypothetical protein